MTSTSDVLRAALPGTPDRGDLETTIRTLQEITRRARGIPARPTTTEGNR